MGVRYFGSAVRRVEDPVLITGRGKYLDDLKIAGVLHAAFVRAGHAHARIVTVDCTAARKVPGVVAVYAAADLGEVARKEMPHTVPVGHLKQPLNYQPLADREVCHVGVPIVVVIAESRSIAEDAAALVEVDYEVLDAVADWRTALNADAPRVHLDSPDNLVASLHGRFGAVEEVFSKAPHVFSETFETHRGGCHSMEGRGVAALPDPMGEGLTIWTSTQMPHMVRRLVADHLGCDERTVRVIAPNVGGGFGPKGVFYSEEVVVPLVALKLGRPVKWVEDRSEHFVSTAQQRDQAWVVEVAADHDGRLLAVRGRCIHDNGAYVPYGTVAAVTSLAAFPGPYALQAVDIQIDVVFTNLVPNTPVRGAGRPTACFVLERLADRVARELSLDPADVRRRSFVRKDQFPYLTGMKARDGSPISFDSGDYHACLEAVLERAGDDFIARQESARASGRFIGRGIASYVEDTGLAPFEGATVRVEPNGKVVVQSGAASQGQGHATIFAQICADILGVRLEDIVVEAADTDKFPLGIGAIASRTAVTAGSSVHQASVAVRSKAIKIASEMFEVSEADLVLEDGVVRVVGVPGMQVPLAQIAFRLNGMSGMPMVAGVEPGLSATAYYEVRKNTFANGTHLCEVEVDIDTGRVEITRYVVGHDCGKLINPMLVDGQVRGGVVHGIGNALFERMIYDEAGQPVTTNYADYLLPTAPEIPRIEIIHVESPSPLNPIGVKGAGEGGTIPAAACVIAAIEDALKPFHIRITEHPVSPARLRDLIRTAQA
ncbi:xanthine dehydrogenase family protein molybdopterin-binding subunit [Bradyrhizobium sp. SYSU BS000235]|uniref:xanthine dehydrogenase family protein molybdopterin-binding subunit n=1 Tax=Bradyrhizobium sp. SYSU BS000235 TaxID=3411332 RepID=UPI003C7277D4